MRMNVRETKAEEFECTVTGRSVAITVALYEFRSKRGTIAITLRPTSCAGFSVCGLFKTNSLPQNIFGTGCPLIESVTRDPVWKL